MPSEPPPSGAFDCHPDIDAPLVRTKLKAREYVLLKKHMAAIRKPQEWTGAFIVRLHRELFGELFPQQSGRARTGAVTFGDRAGVEPEVVYDLLSAASAKIRSALERAREIGKDEGALIEHAFLSAAQIHAEL